MQIRKVFLYLIIAIFSISLITFIVPIIVAFANVFSRVILNELNADEWTGFLGNIVGGIISGIITIIVLILTLNHNAKINQKGRMPYLTIYKKVENDSTFLYICNIGCNSAVNIQSDKRLSIWDETNKNGKYSIPPLAVSRESKYIGDYILGYFENYNKCEIKFEFQDLDSKNYSQVIILNKYGDVVYNPTPNKNQFKAN